MELAQDRLDLTLQLGFLSVRIDVKQRHKSVPFVHGARDLDLHRFFIFSAEVSVDEVVQLLTELLVDLIRVGPFSLLQSFNRRQGHFSSHEVHAVQLLDQSVLDFSGLEVHAFRKGQRLLLSWDVVDLQNKAFTVCLVRNACLSLVLDLVQNTRNIVRLKTHFLSELDRLNSVHSHVRLRTQAQNRSEKFATLSKLFNRRLVEPDSQKRWQNTVNSEEAPFDFLQLV